MLGGPCSPLDGGRRIDTVDIDGVFWASRVAAAAAMGFIAIGAAPARAAEPACGSVVTKSTTLQRNLTNYPGDGLVIGADNLTLDLGSHTIEGTATSTTPGSGSPAIAA